MAVAFILFLGLHHLLQTRREVQAAHHISRALAHGLPDSWSNAEQDVDRILETLFVSNRGRRSDLPRAWVRMPCSGQNPLRDVLDDRQPTRMLALCRNGDQNPALHFWVRSSHASAGTPRVNVHLTAPLERAASCAAGFCTPERREWLGQITRSWQSTPRGLRFRFRVADGGPTRAVPPFNLTRDCLFSPQGYDCTSQTTRAPGQVARTLTQLRQTSAAVQIALCAAESCARAPYPPACAASLVATGAAALSPTGQPPTQCPALVAVVESAHSLAQATLRAAEANEKRINLCLSARLFKGLKNEWMCRGATKEPQSKGFRGPRPETGTQVGRR